MTAYVGAMTLDEAIVHARNKIALHNKAIASYEQLASWLEDLRRFKAYAATRPPEHETRPVSEDEMNLLRRTHDIGFDEGWRARMEVDDLAAARALDDDGQNDGLFTHTARKKT